MYIVTCGQRLEAIISRICYLDSTVFHVPPEDVRRCLSRELLRKHDPKSKFMISDVLPGQRFGQHGRAARHLVRGVRIEQLFLHRNFVWWDSPDKAAFLY